MKRLAPLLILAVALEQGVQAQDSLNVRRLGQIETPGSASGVAVSGNYAYVADGSGLRVINIANPASPTEVGFCDTPGSAFSVAVSGSYAYVADYSSGLRVINIANPASPTEVGFYDTPDVAQGVAVSGNYAYVADENSGLRVINIANPASPTEVGFYDTQFAIGVAVSGTYAYVADYSSGLRVINIANPASPTEVGFYDTPGHASDVVISGSYAYVADWGSGLWVINIANPASPTEVGFYDTPGNAGRVADSGSYAYVGDGVSGLRVIDVSNPAAPVETGFYDTPGYAFGVAVEGTIAYVADGDYFGIYDCSAAVNTSPLRLTSPNGGEQWPLFSTQTVTWSSDSVDGLIRIELNRDYPSGTWEVSADNTADDNEEEIYVTGSLSDNCRIRISLIGDTLSDVSGGDFSIVTSSGILRLVRPAQPNNPVNFWYAGVLQEQDTLSESFRLKNFGSEEIVVFAPPEPPSAEFSLASTCADSFTLVPGQMSTCNVTLFYHPQANGEHYDTLLIRTNASNGDANGFFRLPLEGQLILSADENASLPTAFALHPIYPNPFNTTTQIRFDVPQTAPVQIRIYDLQGRVVENLASRMFEAGSHSLTFDASGRASGMYVVRMNTSGEFTSSQKLVLLK